MTCMNPTTQQLKVMERSPLRTAQEILRRIPRACDSPCINRSPNLNAFVECWIRRVKDEFLSKLIFFGRSSAERALKGTRSANRTLSPLSPPSTLLAGGRDDVDDDPRAHARPARAA